MDVEDDTKKTTVTLAPDAEKDLFGKTRRQRLPEAYNNFENTENIAQKTERFVIIRWRSSSKT